jgi:hypothetical protein
MTPCLKVLFNKILKEEKYPEMWNTSYMIPIHKKGCKSDADNYRCLSVGSAMGKIFNFIINERQISHIEDRNLLSNTQSGF